MEINKLVEEPTVNFASEELTKYLSRILSNQDIIVHTDNLPGNENAPSIKLGLFSQLDVSETPDLQDLKDVQDEEFDDAVYIKVKSGSGVIAGINPRSVLLAVYYFLSSIGCNWLRPGKDGESLPKLGREDLNCYAAEKASYRHRGICIEGANSYENIRDIIDWAPKVGFNSYFFQFSEAFTFFDRYYSHVNNPLKKAEPFTVEQAKEYVASASKELEKRGMIHHAVGHGWTCEPFGIPGMEWAAHEQKLPEETKNIMAEIDGKRELWKGVPLNTNLCYSNPTVRTTIAEAIAEYLINHPEVDILHFWLADGTNNQCECENCKDTLPSDYYVMMLNELDELLTAKKISRKVVFLIYVDLLWPPQKQRINNPDRFIMMYAPITRTYRSSFDTDKEIPKLTPYKRNKCKFPKSVEANLAFLKAWQLQFPGDSFDFDYHYMWAHYDDPGYVNIARILHKDLQNLKKIGLNGFISCQTQRAFFPTGLGMHIMGRTLWNRDLDFESIKEDYYYGAFGEESKAVSEYLTKLSQLFLELQIMQEAQNEKEKAEKWIKKITNVVNDFSPAIERNIGHSDKSIRYSWQLLKLHQKVCINLARIQEAKLHDDKSKAVKLWDEIKILVQEKEDELHNVLDVFLFISTLERRLDLK